MNLIRRIVSGQKKRFQHGPDGFDLDLAYVAPRVIAMGLPAAQGKEVLYRNPMQETARFLQTYHRGHAKVYNLCSEHTYNAQHLSVAVQQYPYDDHQTPPLAMIQQFCADAAAWLAADPVNVVVVHCKAGKGRTGIMICSLLLYLHKNAPDLANLAADMPAGGLQKQQNTTRTCSCGADGVLCRTCQAGGLFGVSSSGRQQQQYSNRLWHPWQHVAPVQLRQLEQPVRDILDMYAERRTHDGNGVTIKSQRRYVGYFWAVLCSGPSPEGVLPPPRTVQLRQVTISGLPSGTADSCELLVEARPSGSLAPRAAIVCRRSAPRATSGTGAGFCMVPCAHAPLVQDDSCCVSTGPHGDTLTFRMPAASMGLSSLSTQQQDSFAGTGVMPDPAQQHGVVTSAGDASAAAAGGGCTSCGASAAAPCVCFASSGALPGAVPAAAEAEQRSGAHAAPGAAEGGCLSSSGAGLAEDCWDAAEQAGCCVLEGDVRFVLRRGSTKLCYTWFNTAFLPEGGCYTLTRAQLDKPVKGLADSLTLTVRFVDMQPTVEGEDSLTAGAEKLPGQQSDLEKQQQQKAPWLFGFQEPPLETSNKPAKGSAQQQGKQKRGKTLSLLAEAVPTVPGLIGTACSPAKVHASSGGADRQYAPIQRHVRSSSDEAHPFAEAAAQQSELHPGSATGGGYAAVAPISASAPASPQGRKLRSSGSWRQHLPAITSISTSSLLWGTGPGVEIARHDSPRSWCGSAAHSWDWDTLAAFCDDEDGIGGAAAATGSAPALPGSAGFRTWGGSSNRDGGSSGAHSIGTVLQQDLHRSAGTKAVASSLLPLPSQASIELPVMVKRPSGVDSLVDALLDPEHSTTSQTSNAMAAAAAAAASGRVLASEASSSAVAGQAAAAGYKPPGQLRKGYSWHGSNGWFAAMAAAAGSGSSSPAASCSGSTGKQGGRHIQADQRWSGQQAGSCGVPDLAHGCEEHLGLVVGEASLLDLSLEPLLLCEGSSAVPGSVLSSCDPVQGLLEALNWSTDVERYHAPEQQHSSNRPPACRRSTSSAPGSPKRGGGLLPTVMSSPVLHTCRSAPASPEQSVAPLSTPRDAAGVQPASQRHVRPRSRGVEGGHSSSAGSSRRRPRVSRAGQDVCRLLDLEDWAEDEAEGCDGGEVVCVSVAHAKDAAVVSSRAGSAAAQLSRTASSQSSLDTAAAADLGSSVTKRTQRAERARKPSSGAAAASAQGRGRSGAAARDESRLGLLAADGPSAPSCGAQGPLLQQWQQLEKAWQKSWWV